MFVRRKIKTFWTLSTFEKKLIWHAWYWMIMAKVLIPFAHFRVLKRLLGAPMVEHCVRLSVQEQRLAKQVKQAVQQAEQLLPFHCQCFVLAIAAKLLLKRHAVPATLYLGVAKESQEKLIAHAWVRAGKLLVTGGAGHQIYTVTGTFT